MSILLVPQGLDRVEPRRLPRRPEAEADAEPDRDDEADHRGPERDEGREHELDQFGRPPTEQDAEDSAEPRERRRLDQELEDDVAAPRPDRLAHTDLLGPLGD